MVKRMLIDAGHAEETRVVVASGTRLEEFDFESAARKQLKGNVYLAKIMREIGRAHVWTPVTSRSRMPSSAW